VQFDDRKMTVKMTADEIAALIPHGRGMSMISEIVAWDANTIQCRSDRLTQEENPLCEKGELTAIVLIEYAAQAAAVHGALLNSALGEDRPAYIGAIKNIDLFDQQIVANRPLEIYADCLLNNGAGAIYEVVVQQEQPLLRGKLILSQP
jgi:predicted hotdog family 3-hydroxylacyl-ACP dehydratase